VDYFESHPEAKANIIAKGKVLLRREWKNTHRFEYRNGETKCWVCGQDWYDDASEMKICLGFQKPKDLDMQQHIVDVIVREEKLYSRTLSRCRDLVKKTFSVPEQVNAEALAMLYTTHGCDPSTVEDVLDCRIPEHVHSQYMELIERERALSRAAQKKEIITVQP
jgi:hypothetical protein